MWGWVGRVIHMSYTLVYQFVVHYVRYNSETLPFKLKKCLVVMPINLFAMSTCRLRIYLLCPIFFPKIHMTCYAYMSILYETIFEIKYFEHIYYQYLSVIIYLYLQQSDNKINSRILVYWHDQNEQYVRYLHLVFCHSLFVPIYNDSLKIKGLHFRL